MTGRVIAAGLFGSALAYLAGLIVETIVRFLVRLVLDRARRTRALPPGPPAWRFAAPAEHINRPTAAIPPCDRPISPIRARSGTAATAITHRPPAPARQTPRSYPGTAEGGVQRSLRLKENISSIAANRGEHCRGDEVAVGRRRVERLQERHRLGRAKTLDVKSTAPRQNQWSFACSRPRRSAHSESCAYAVRVGPPIARIIVSPARIERGIIFSSI